MGVVRDCPETVRKLHAELFSETEMVQGEAWISDAADFETLEDFFAQIESHYFYSREASKTIRRFLHRHTALRRKYRQTTNDADRSSEKEKQ